MNISLNIIWKHKNHLSHILSQKFYCRQGSIISFQRRV